MATQNENKHMAKKKKAKRVAVKRGNLTIDEIKELGGEKSDLQLIDGVEDEDDDTEVIDDKEDFEADPINRDELRDFIKNLGLDKYSAITLNDEGEIVPEKIEKKKEKKVPLLIAPGKEETDDTESAPPEKIKEKSKRNKYKVQHDEVSTTTPTKDLEQNFTDYMSKYQPRKYLLVKPGGKWQTNRADIDTDFEPASHSLVAKLKQFATKLYSDEIALYKKQEESKKKSDSAWLKTVLVSGTLSDKIAALTLINQQAPVHSLPSLETMVAMVSKKNRRECFMALDSVRELFLSELLLEKGKLKSFEEHPLSKLDELTSGNKDARDKRLLLWYFEGELKDKYAKLVKTLETLAFDNLTATKQKILTTVFDLLSNNAEQEKTLLTILVNKLGDPDYKIASKCCHYLSKLVERHPNMKLVILREVERILYRPNILAKAQYYSVCFLNQLLLSQEESELAARLITIYFSFFKSFVKKGEVDGKMLNALLTGVNRAYPYAKSNKEKISEQINTLYKVVHMVKFNTSIQALMLLYQVTDSSDSASDRYYVALYHKLLDPGLKTSSKHPMFLNLLYKSMKKDVVGRRVKAFVKRLLQVCGDQQPSFICGALILISEVLKERPEIVSLAHVCEDSDDEEHFEDVKDEDGDDAADSDGSEDADQTSVVAEETVPTTKAPSWIHRKNYNKSEQGDYDAYHRNPLYCRADQECVWELQKLCQHYHPSAALFASMLAKGENISYSGDPLEDFTLFRFLERFVYRNPKKKDKDQKPQSALTSKHKNYVPRGVRGIAVNTDEYLLKGEERIPADEKFLFKYFSQRASKAKANEPQDVDSDADSVSDGEFDNFLDSYEKQFDGDDRIEFDFASEFSKKKNKSKSDGNDGSDDEDDDDDDLDDDLSDEEPDFDGDDFGGAFDDFDEDDEDDDIDKKKLDFDEEDVEFSDDNDELSGMDFSSKKSGKTSKRKMGDDKEDMLAFAASTKGKKPKKDKSNLSEFFAAAEEFGDLIDENADSKFDMIGTEALSNKDKANVKQLKWETDRVKWMEGRDWKSKKRGKQQRKSFNKHGKSKKGPFQGHNKKGAGGKRKKK